MALSFSDQVKNWGGKTKLRMELVFQESIQDLAREMNKPIDKGGNMPVDTSFLVNSFSAAINSTQLISANVLSGTTWDSSGFTTIVNTAKIGDSVTIGYTAVYAARMEYGFTGVDSLGRYYEQKGYGFMRLAVQNWPQIVKQSIRRMDARIAFSGKARK